IRNKKISKLKGGCNLYVKVQLPAATEIEVYSESRLVSKRFFPMSVEQLLKQLDSGFNDDKLAAITTFLESYAQARKRPKLAASDQEEILEEFTFADKYKFTALRKLYRY